MLSEQNVSLIPSHESNMIVVDTQHRLLVTRLVGDLSRLEDEDEQLGLTLIKLYDASTAADETARQVQKRGLKVPAPPQGERWTSEDHLLANLRAVFGWDYGGWVPVMGKNRTMTGIQFVPYPNVAGPAGLNGPIPVSDADRPPDPDISILTDSTAGKDVLVGLLDTRLYRHSKLANRYVAAPLSELPLTAPEDDGWPYNEGHATFAAGLILSRAPSAHLDVRPVFPAQHAGTSAGWRRPVWDVAREMVRYLREGAQILNCSWACYTEDGRPPAVLERALALLTPKLLVVAAAGNHGRFRSKEADDAAEQGDSEYRRNNELPGPWAPAYPAALPNVLAVGALDGEEPATFNPIARDVGGSDKGRSAELAPWINVLAPGVAVKGPYFGDGGSQKVQVLDEEQLARGKRAYQTKDFTGEAVWSGTSFAAAIVSGALAARLRHGRTAQEAVAELLAGDIPGIRRRER